MLSAVKEHTITIIDKLLPLLEPHQYKILYGGRGGVKSWTVARVLLAQGMKEPLRILCCREVQESIEASVYTLLADQVKALGMEDFYEVNARDITAKNGTSIIFHGLADQTADSMKSFEAIDRAWVEEGQTVSKKSWDILDPTIRKTGSEIWVTFNPDLATDETYVRFVEHPPANAFVCYLTYRDNPWHTKEMEDKRAHAQRTMSKDDYEHIWEGKPSAAASGAIYANEVSAMVLSGRYRDVPYDPRLKVHVVCDLGWHDKFAVGLWQRGLSDIRCIGYKEYQFQTPDKIAAELVSMRLNWGKLWLPWDGFITARQTGLTDADVFRSYGFNVQPIQNEKNAMETRIKALRYKFQQIYADHGETSGVRRLMECWKRFKRSVPKHGEPMAPVPDEYIHGCDMSGYMALVVEKFTNDDEGLRVVLPQQRVFDRALGQLG